MALREDSTDQSAALLVNVSTEEPSPTADAHSGGGIAVPRSWQKPPVLYAGVGALVLLGLAGAIIALVAGGGSSSAPRDQNGRELVQEAAPDDPCNTLCAMGRWAGWDKMLPFLATSTVTTTTLTQTTSTSTLTTTTITTTSPCKVLNEGDPCYSGVLETMRCIQNGTASYEGLGVWSSVEEVQTYLANQGEHGCDLPCECHSMNREWGPCYQSVLWAMYEGLNQHPEWYEGLTINSSFEDFQGVLFESASNETQCPRPCKAAWKASPSLFCWTVVRPDGYERAIMAAALDRGAGIFGCDGFALFSEYAFNIGVGPGRLGNVTTIAFENAAVGTSKDGTAANTLIFMRAWLGLKSQTNALQYDFALKVDPDAVVLVDRLRDHLREQTGYKVFVRNCNKFPKSPAFPALFGSLEVLSQRALQAYYDGEELCHDNLNWTTWGEDYFMDQCLDYLNVSAFDDFGIISDGVCLGVKCENWWSAAFHPFKDVGTWLQCWDAATAGQPPNPVLP